MPGRETDRQTDRQTDQTDSEREDDTHIHAQIDECTKLPRSEREREGEGLSLPFLREPFSLYAPAPVGGADGARVGGGGGNSPHP